MTLQRIENLISHVLRIGVGVSLLVIVAGTVTSFVHHPGYLWSPQALPPLTTPVVDAPPTLHTVLAGVLAGRGRSLVMLGLILLIATPVLRVAVSVVVFLIQEDLIFVALTMVVLGLLVGSFFVGGAGG
jgi:uncharacterized membrane protein